MITHRPLSHRALILLAGWLLCWAMTGCVAVGKSPGLSAVAPEPLPSATPAMGVEQPVVVIDLAGPMAAPEAEISGMAWYGDYLVLAPQYPDRWQNSLYYLTKTEILAFLDGALDTPLTPRPIPLVAPNLQVISGYEGVEGIKFLGDRVYVTVEARPSAMQGYLFAGTIAPDLSLISLDTANPRPIAPQTDISNMSDEAITIVGDTIVTFYEANGAAINPAPVAHRFDLDLNPLPDLPFANLEYRVTDATLPDGAGNFWVLNFFWPGEQKLAPIPDPLVDRYGTGPTHRETAVVERLVAMHYSPEGITLVDRPPVELTLLGGLVARNWEGLALLDQRGFLLVTDLHPTTILAFVSAPSP